VNVPPETANSLRASVAAADRDFAADVRADSVAQPCPLARPRLAVDVAYEEPTPLELELSVSFEEPEPVQMDVEVSFEEP
jgi:hypothetical protein